MKWWMVPFEVLVLLVITYALYRLALVVAPPSDEEDN